jgi:hypothetical protein
VPQDYKEALKWFRLAAEGGDARAQHNIGVIYHWGQGVPPDYKEALKWYRLAADRGIAEAQRNLGNMYDDGLGVPQDYEEALKWYRLAAAQGNAKAQFNLGAMYDNGQGVPQDYKEALKWFRLAADQGFADAKTAIDAITARLEKERKQISVAAAQDVPKLESQAVTGLGRLALVIGNDSYKSVEKLKNARADAKAIADNLTAVGYRVTLKEDLNEKEMKSAIRTLASQVQGGDEVLFFFAGHGVQLGAANYLLPVDIVGDTEAQVRDEALPLQRILDDMAEQKAKLTLAVIDACRDNPFKSAGRAIGGRGLAPTTAATGQMVIFSAGTGQQALDKLDDSDENMNGLFTRVFIQEMQKPNVSIDRLIRNVREQVAALAKSVGHEQVPAIYDQVLGDFYFKK